MEQEDYVVLDPIVTRHAGRDGPLLPILHEVQAELGTIDAAAETRARLIYMANQIARNFRALDHNSAAAATADHIVRFWDPRMKAGVSGDEAELSPVAARAFAILRDQNNIPPQTQATIFNDVNERGRSDAG